jgi:hypothetical protein
MQTKAMSFFQQGQWLIWIAIDSPIKPALIVMPNDWKVKKAEKKFPRSKKCLDRFSEASISQEYCVNRVKNFAEKKNFFADFEHSFKFNFYFFTFWEYIYIIWGPIEPQLYSLKLPTDQGDQIGRIFAYGVAVFV